MRIDITEDSWYPAYTARTAGDDTYAPVEVTTEFWARYLEAMAAFNAVQRELGALYDLTMAKYREIQP